MLKGLEAVWALLSLTCTVILLVPEPVGVPEIAPVDADNESPTGRVPDVIDQLYGDVPPVAAKVALYDAFCCPLGNVVVVIVGVPFAPAGKNVAMRALQLAAPLKLNAPVYVPAEEVTAVSFAARELVVSCWASVSPLPAVTVPVKLGVLNPAPTNTNSLALCVTPVGPVLTLALLLP